MEREKAWKPKNVALAMLISISKELKRKEEYVLAGAIQHTIEIVKHL